MYLVGEKECSFSRWSAKINSLIPKRANEDLLHTAYTRQWWEVNCQEICRLFFSLNSLSCNKQSFLIVIPFHLGGGHFFMENTSCQWEVFVCARVCVWACVCSCVGWETESLRRDFIVSAHNISSVLCQMCVCESGSVPGLCVNDRIWCLV